jgi:transposase
MAVYIGVDLHVRTQTLCWCSDADGEQHEHTLDHQRDDLRAFYSQFPTPAIIGVESSGYSLWFHALLADLGHQLRVGDALAIRQFARRRQKNDRRDARLLLDLLRHDDFPAVHMPAPASREVLALLRYRHRLVRMRTMLRNGLQAVALNHRLRLGPKLFTLRGQQQFAALPLAGACAMQRQHSALLLATLAENILAVENELALRAASDPRVTRLRSHPGVGLLTSLAVVHTLDPVARFPRARCVAAYCGLDPRERSSGDIQRFGHISKQGNRLLRFLLIEAAHNAIRGDEQLRRFYFQLTAKKNSSIAVVAVARKLVLRLFAMLRDDLDYDQFRRRGRDARRARECTSQEFPG